LRAQFFGVCKPVFTAQEAKKKHVVLTEITLTTSGLEVWDMEQSCMEDSVILRSKNQCSSPKKLHL